MENKKNKTGIVKKVIGDLKESTKIQHEITKERHDTLVKTSKDAKTEFKERHMDARKAPIQKQKEELEKLKKMNTK